MTEFTGWKHCDTIIIVARSSNDDIPQGYLVDPNNKSQLESARSWARGYRQGEPKEYTFENNNFSIEFYEASKVSYVTKGRLSFWNCIISKDGYKFKVGIASDLLIGLILGSHIEMGKVQEKVFFATCKGQVGIMHEGMKEYKDLQRDLDTRKQMSTGKTTKWQLGKIYSTLTSSETYLFDAYSWLKSEQITVPIGPAGFNYTREVTKVTLLKQPVKKHACIDVAYMLNADKKSLSGKELLRSTHGSSYIIHYRDKFPARKLDTQHEVAIDFNHEDVANIFQLTDHMIELLNSGSIFSHERIAYTPTPDYPKEWLEYFRNLTKLKGKSYIFEIEK